MVTPLHREPEFRSRWMAICVWWCIIALVAACIACAVSTDWQRVDRELWQGYSPEARAFDPTCPLHETWPAGRHGWWPADPTAAGPAALEVAP